MGKIAFVFSGQGDQHPGMGQDYYNESAAAHEVLDKLELIRQGTREQCFEGSAEVLGETINTQPCLFAVEAMIAAALKEAGIKADMAAGFSLGELSAVCYAGALSAEEMFGLVIKRAGLMQAAAGKTKAAMAAVLKLDAAKVKEICGEFEEVYPVNFNCPGQITVSGKAESMPDFKARVKAEGGRAIPLNVSGGFHSPFMSEAAEGFKAVLAEMPFKGFDIPVYANLNASPYGDTPGDVRTTLAAQISSPVQWEETIRRMIADGADTFIEIGPGETLTGMIKRIDKGVRAVSAAGQAELKDLVESLA